MVELVGHVKELGNGVNGFWSELGQGQICCHDLFNNEIFEIFIMIFCSDLFSIWLVDLCFFVLGFNLRTVYFEWVLYQESFSREFPGILFGVKDGPGPGFYLFWRVGCFWKRRFLIMKLDREHFISLLSNVMASSKSSRFQISGRIIGSKLNLITLVLCIGKLLQGSLISNPSRSNLSKTLAKSRDIISVNTLLLNSFCIPMVVLRSGLLRQWVFLKPWRCFRNPCSWC